MYNLYVCIQYVLYLNFAPVLYTNPINFNRLPVLATVYVIVTHHISCWHIFTTAYSRTFNTKRFHLTCFHLFSPMVNTLSIVLAILFFSQRVRCLNLLFRLLSHSNTIFRSVLFSAPLSFTICFLSQSLKQTQSFTMSISPVTLSRSLFVFLKKF